MGKTEMVWDDAGFKKALKIYLNLKKNADPKKELRRRAKNVGMRLIRIYKAEAPKAQEIKQKVGSLGTRVKVRKSIRDKGRARKWTYAAMIAAELQGRISARGFTATGWFPAVEKLGGKPRDNNTKRTGPKRGSLVEKFGNGEQSETLINSQPGAAYVAKQADTAMQKALNQEVADMVKYIVRKQNEAARRAGL